MKTPAEIVARLPALMPRAVVRVIQGDISSRITQVLHSGLTVWFYDSVAGLPGDFKARVPNQLCIEVREEPGRAGQVRLPEVKLMTGLSKTEIYRRARQADFPKPTRLSHRVWCDVDRWRRQQATVKELIG